MKRNLLLLGLVFLCAVSIAEATQQQFIFGVWQGVPKDATMGQHCVMLHDTLHMNTVSDDCSNDYQLEQYANPAHPLKVIAWNHYFSNNGGMNGYLRLYALAPYTVKESEGTEPANAHLRYIGGQDENIGGVNCHYFQALANPPDSLMLIQTGPGTQGSRLYNQLGWYWPDFMDTTHEPAHLQYKAFLRFKVGPRTGPVSSEPLAAFYMGRYGGPDGVLFPDADTLIEQHPLYLYDSQFDSAGTDFIWSDTLKYQWNNSFIDTLMMVRDVMFNVKWSGKRDIYIDKVKVRDEYGYKLWEDTARAFAQIDSFVTRFYDTSSTVLGWYLQDDQDLRSYSDNVFSTRRVDSLLTNRFSHKPGFLAPGGWAKDYVSLATYSNVSYWSYPIGNWTRSDSDDPYAHSLQEAWDSHTSYLANMSELAESKGVPNYASLQSFVDWDHRVPTPLENLCQVNLALASGVDGILYWRYGGSGVWEDANGRTDFWRSVKDVVGPYIDKMGPIFASLNWKYAWKWGFEEKPTGTPIREILCNKYPSDPIYCPNCLYMQVAEFEPASLSDDTAYFFLVNRRCLPEDSITGTVSFDEFGGVGREHKEFSVTDMLTGTTWICDDHLPPAPTYSFNYAVPPGAGRLYRVTPNCRHHGDANGDGSIDISDATYIIAYIFSGGPAPVPYLAGDSNCDDEVDISDAILLISYIFSGGQAPCSGCA